MKKEVLRLNNISLTSHTSVSLQNISFHLLQGELLGLFGILNSGVKLFIRILREQVCITSGTIYRNEITVNSSSSSLQPRLNIGYVGQTGTLISGLSIKENFIISRQTKGKRGVLLNDNSLNAEIALLLDDLGIGDLFTSTMKPDELSVSEKHLVEIAKHIYAGNDIIVLDEIGYFYLEADFHRLLKLIQKLKSKNISIIYVCSSIDYMAEYLERITVLRDGRNAGTLYPDCFNQKDLLRILLGPSHTTAASVPLTETGQPIIRFSHYSSTSSMPVQINICESETVGIFSFENSFSEELAKLIVSVNLRRKKHKHTHYRVGSEWEVELYNAEKELVVIPQSPSSCAAYPEKSILENYLLLIYRSTSKRGIINHGFPRYMERILDKWYDKEPGWSKKTKLHEADETIQRKLAFHKWLYQKASFAYIEFPGINTDPLLQQTIFSLIHEMTRQNMGILIRSNNIYELLTLCNKLIIISRHGKTIVLSKKEALAMDLFELLVEMK